MINIDGVSYNINVTSLKRTADFLDRYADRTQDGVLHRELIGVYFNYKLQFGQPDDSNVADYQALWDVLSAAVTFHTVTIPNEGASDYTFTAYFANVNDELEIVKGSGTAYWKNLQADFIAQSPAATP